VYVWNWGIIWDNWHLFAQGALMTLFLTGSSIGIGLVAGLFLGLGKLSRRRWLRIPASVFVEVFRDTPLLVLLLWIFYCLPILTGLKIDIIESAILGISIHASAYLAEVYRAGILSVDRGQMESARSLGMSFWQGMQRIVLPRRCAG
jgi:polar amino acid transport system permease protein